MKGDCYCSSTTATATAGTTATAITETVVTTTAGTTTTVTAELENVKWRNLNWCWWIMEKRKYENVELSCSHRWIQAAITAEGIMKKCIVFTCYKTQWYNSIHVNEGVDVKHENKSLDYQPLMNVVNQCKANSPLMSMSVKVPEYILQSANKWADFKPLARSVDQGTLTYSHDCQWENFPLRHESLQVLKRISSLYPR